MKKKLIQHKNYTEFNGYYQLVLPLNLEMLIPEDNSVRLLSHILEGLNYTKLYKAYSSTGRKPAVDPKTMFKVITYANSNNIYSSRKIETACKRDINYMWLLQGESKPDHSTIARFRKDYLPEAIEDLFYQMVQHLHSIGEVKFENLFVDGSCKKLIVGSICVLYISPRTVVYIRLFPKDISAFTGSVGGLFSLLTISNPFLKIELNDS